MNPYFNTPERIAELDAKAQTWLGTPWCANSSACGPRGGVACHNLPRSIYMDCGFLPPAFPKLVGDPNASRFTRISVMEKFLDARPEFLRLGAIQSVIIQLLQPGDLVGVRIGHCVNHLGVLLSGGNFIHVLMRRNTDIDPVAVPPWSQRISAAWRPLEF